MKNYSFVIVLLLLSGAGFSQDSMRLQIRPWVDIPVTASALVANYVGLGIVNSKRSVDSITAYSLDPQAINAFDRAATRQNPEFAVPAESTSDILMNTSLVAPFLLLLDQKVREDWKAYVLIYAEMQGITGSMYSWGSAIHIDRIRPMAYNPREPIERRTGGSTYNSFYSGHVASSTAALFFMAKVYDSYHPETFRGKRWLLYSAASIPPVIIGWYRYRAGKHFPSDLIVGYGVGALTGLLIPSLHMRRKNQQISFVPLTGQQIGIGARMQF